MHQDSKLSADKNCRGAIIAIVHDKTNLTHAELIISVVILFWFRHRASQSFYLLNVQMTASLS